MDNVKLCDTTMTIKASGPEPFTCTLPDGHLSRRHPLVQAGTGATRALTEPSYCSGGRFVFMRQSLA